MAKVCVTCCVCICFILREYGESPLSFRNGIPFSFVIIASILGLSMRSNDIPQAVSLCMRYQAHYCMAEDYAYTFVCGMDHVGVSIRRT